LEVSVGRSGRTIRMKSIGSSERNFDVVTGCVHTEFAHAVPVAQKITPADRLAQPAS